MPQTSTHQDNTNRVTARLSAKTITSPFGSSLPNRAWSDVSRGYRYGFNGKEKDAEGMGGGSATYDYGFRIYNPNLGKFLSVDPLTGSYPWYTTYQFAGNKVIIAIDVDGLEEYIVIDYIANNNETYSKLKLVNANLPFKVSYYSTTIPFVDNEFPTDISKATLISTINLTNINFENGYNGFRTRQEFTNALSAHLTAIDDITGGNSNFTWKTKTIKPEIIIPSKKPKPLPYKGKTIKKGSELPIAPSIGWLGTKEYGASAKNGQLGSLTSDGEKELNLIANSINSLGPKSISNIVISISWDVGTKTLSAEEDKKAFETIVKVKDNAVKYLESRIKDKSISVSGSTNIIKSGDPKNTNTKIKFN